MGQVFDFKDYREFLVAALDEAASRARGARTRFAEAVGCQRSYLSHVLSGKADLTPEQAERANEFFRHTEDQADYLLLLVSHARAGTPKLKDRYFRRISRTHSEYWRIRNRMKPSGAISKEAQRVYFSSWRYAAITMAVMAPALQTAEAIAEHLRLPLTQVIEDLDFLVGAGVVAADGRAFRPKETWIFSSRDRDLGIRDHVNWRIKAISSVDRLLPTDLHYSSVLSVSREGFEKFRARLIHALEEIDADLKGSRGEKVSALLVDFFDV